MKNNYQINIILFSFIIGLLCIIFLKNKKENFEVNTNNQLEKFKKIFSKCLIINLPETKIGQERWQKIKRIYPLNHIGKKFNGVYGKYYDYNPEIEQGIVTKKWDFGKWKYGISDKINMSDPEIGVILSHYYIWDSIERNNLESIMVIEDDASKLSKDFIPRCLETMDYVPNDWDIILFGFACHKGNKGTQVNNVIWKVEDFILLHCYLINKKAVKKIKKMLPINMPLDSWLSSKSNKLNIYRHNFVKSKRAKNPSSRIIRQAGLDKLNINTNNL